jgi:hypothetical protein
VQGVSRTERPAGGDAGNFLGSQGGVRGTIVAIVAHSYDG